MIDATRLERQTARSTTLGELALASRRLGALSLPRLELKSADFHDGGILPTRATIDGDGTPPPLSWTFAGPDPAQFALVCEDPDAPRPTPFVHWLVYGIAGHVRSIDANLNDFYEGLNDHDQIGFAPAAPPPGESFHRYIFQLFALDTEVKLAAGRNHEQVLAALAGHVTHWGELVGLYKRL